MGEELVRLTPQPLTVTTEGRAPERKFSIAGAVGTRVVLNLHTDGRAFRCTFCYDRQKDGLQPACASACPTGSILFGDLEAMERAADARIAKLHDAGMTDAKIWNPKDTSVGGTHAIFLIRGDERSYNLPVAPEVPTTLLKPAWTSAAAAAGVMAIGALLAFALGSRR